MAFDLDRLEAKLIHLLFQATEEDVLSQRAPSNQPLIDMITAVKAGRTDAEDIKRLEIYLTKLRTLAIKMKNTSLLDAIRIVEQLLFPFGLPGFPVPKRTQFSRVAAGGLKRKRSRSKKSLRRRSRSRT